MPFIIEEFFPTDHDSQQAINILKSVLFFLLFFHFYLILQCRYLKFHILHVSLFCNAYVALKYGVLMFCSLLFIMFLLLLCNFVTFALTVLRSAIQLFP